MVGWVGNGRDNLSLKLLSVARSCHATPASHVRLQSLLESLPGASAIIPKTQTWMGSMQCATATGLLGPCALLFERPAMLRHTIMPTSQVPTPAITINYHHPIPGHAPAHPASVTGARQAAWLEAASQMCAQQTALSAAGATEPQQFGGLLSKTRRLTHLDHLSASLRFNSHT